MQDHRQHSPKQSQTGYHRQHDKPEPEDRVDLLVDDVERHHAKRVVLLYGAGRAVLVEDALGHLETGRKGGAWSDIVTIACESQFVEPRSPPFPCAKEIDDNVTVPGDKLDRKICRDETVTPF